MQYISTRDQSSRVSSAQAIAMGISKEGGLFVPESFPKVSIEDLRALIPLSYDQRALKILSRFLTDYPREELRGYVEKAYCGPQWDGGGGIAPISKLCPDQYVLELWHGPTCAFKDMALQLLPGLLTGAAAKTMPGKTLVILAATSGDTGKAALEGFRDVPGTRIAVFYPANGVSPMQERQMVTQEGGNVSVCAVEGNFDDAQGGVKEVFTDSGVIQALSGADMAFSSANSINWGRLAPQIAYYFSAYCDLAANEEIFVGEEVNAAVPTGNFGNLLAAYYAKQMGLPLGRFICASNANNVLTEFLQTGVYNRNRDFYTTISPSMDILVSSNLERLLYQLCGGEEVVRLMAQLKGTGRYSVSPEVLTLLKREFYGASCTDQETEAYIRKIFETYDYLCDPHTAVAFGALEKYRKETGDGSKAIVVSTASPFKFPGSVLKAVDGEEGGGPQEDARALSRLSGIGIPAPLSGLWEKPVRFADTCAGDSASMRRKVLDLLGLS